MTERFRVSSTTLAWLQIAALVFATLSPILLSSARVSAAQLGARSITLESSEAGLAGVTYDIDFDVSTNHSNLEEIVVDFCTESPLLGDTCTLPTGMSVAAGGLSVTSTNIGTAGNYTISNVDTTGVVIDLATEAAAVTADGGATPVVPDDVQLAIDGFTNPTGVNETFYARIVTYDVNGAAASYTSASPNAHVDDGGIAMSTAEQITVTARVQEQLNFCIGTANPGANCTGVSGTDIDLGVLTNTDINHSSEDNDGEGIEYAYAQLSTNASRGAVITYYGDDLKVAGETCTGTSLDQCITPNADGDASVLTNTAEGWGLGVSSLNGDAHGTTTNLTVAEAYNLDAAEEYSFVANTTTTLANSDSSSPSTSVVDNEELQIDFAATAAATTPAGIYQTTLTFVATGTF